MTEADARTLLRDWPGLGGIEAWIASRRWKTAPGGWTVTGELQGWLFRINVVSSGVQVSASIPGKDDPAVWIVTGRSRVTSPTGASTCRGMSRPPDDPQPPPPPEKPKITAEERRIRDADRLATIRLRMAISRTLEERGITTPTAIAEALGMPAAEAAKLMTGRRWHPDTVALLEAAVTRLGRQHR